MTEEEAAAVERPALSRGEWISTRTGVLRSQYTTAAVEQHVASLLSGLEGGSLPARTLQQLSEQCVPIMHLPRSKPVVEALLQCTTTVPDGGGEGGRGLAEGFLERLTELEMSSEVTLSYEAQTTLWCTHLPSFKQELLSRCEQVKVLHERGAPPSWDALTAVLEAKHLPRACAEHPKLFAYLTEFLKVLCFASKGSPSVLRLVECFNSCLAHSHHKLVVGHPPLVNLTALLRPP